MDHKRYLFDVWSISDESIETVKTLILSYQVRVTYNLLKEWGILIKRIYFLLLFLASIKGILVKVFILTILGVLEEELLANVFVSFDSDFPLRVFDALKNAQRCNVVSVFIRGSFLLDFLLIAFCLV